MVDTFRDLNSDTITSIFSITNNGAGQMLKLNTTNQMIREFERVLGKPGKTSIAIATKQARAERVFKNANPGWVVVQPWIEGLHEVYNPAEHMLTGKFKVFGPLGNTREVRANVYRDGIRVC